MQKTFSILSVVFFLFLFSQCASDQRRLNRLLMQEAAILNAAAPMMLNDYIRFDRASVTSDNRFQYRYTVLNTENPDSLVESSLQDFKAMARLIYFTNPEMAIFRENRVTIEYIYSDENGRIIRTIIITPEDYNQL